MHVLIPQDLVCSMSLNAKLFPGVFSIREAQERGEGGEVGTGVGGVQSARGKPCLPECTAATNRNRGGWKRS